MTTRSARALVVGALCLAASAALAPPSSAVLPPGPVLLLDTCATASLPGGASACPLPRWPLEPTRCPSPTTVFSSCELPYIAAGAQLAAAVCSPDCGGVPGLNVGGAVFPPAPFEGEHRVVAFADDTAAGLRTGVIVCQDLDGDRVCGGPGEPLLWTCGHFDGIRARGGVPVVVAVVNAGVEPIPDHRLPYHCQGTAGTVSAHYGLLE
jgi:hypothetical protein